MPDYKGRHVFTAKLRLVIFLVFWSIGIFYFEPLWQEAPWVPLAISLAFLLTGVCYHNILKNRGLVFFFLVELAADLMSVTLVVYLTGGESSDYFTLYLMYCLAAGVFYNYQVATVAAILSLIFYLILVVTLRAGLLLPFHGEIQLPEWLSGESLIGLGRILLLAMFLPVVVYGVKIINIFSRFKERALEERNKQLVALNRISSTIRKVMSPEKVVQQVLAGVVEGLGYEVCLLVLLDKQQDLIHFHIPKKHPVISQIEDIVGIPLSDMTMPRGVRNSIFTAIRRNRVVFRQELGELVKGVQPPWPQGLAEKVQSTLHFKKFVIMPLVAERRVMGALIGISRTEFVDENRVGVLENFSNQAALAIESAQLFEELRTKNVELERANKIKSEFLAIMSHELRTPLTAILGFSELLLEGVMGDLNLEQQDSLREVMKNGEHLLHLINSILDLAKVEAGKMELAPESFSLADLIQDVKGSLAPLIQKKNQQLLLELQEPLPLLYADPTKLRQILLNLLSNANKFTPEEGKLTLKVRHWLKLPECFDPIQLRGLAPCQEGYFEIDVQDTGIGISPKDQRDIFDLFQQVDSSFTRRYQGTGLGLALTRKFVLMHGGVIWVTSESDKGSIFTVILPAVPSHETSPPVFPQQVESLVLGARQLMET